MIWLLFVLLVRLFVTASLLYFVIKYSINYSEYRTFNSIFAFVIFFISQFVSSNGMISFPVLSSSLWDSLRFSNTASSIQNVQVDTSIQRKDRCICCMISRGRGSITVLFGRELIKNICNMNLLIVNVDYALSIF